MALRGRMMYSRLWPASNILGLYVKSKTLALIVIITMKYTKICTNTNENVYISNHFIVNSHVQFNCPSSSSQKIVGQRHLFLMQTPSILKETLLLWSIEMKIASTTAWKSYIYVERDITMP